MILGAAFWVLSFLVMVWVAWRLARLVAAPRAPGYRPPAGTSARAHVNPYRGVRIVAWGVAFGLLCLCFATTAGRLWGSDGAATGNVVRGGCLVLVAFLGGLFLVLSALNRSRRSPRHPRRGRRAVVPVLTAVVPALVIVGAVFAAVALVLR